MMNMKNRQKMSAMVAAAVHAIGAVSRLGRGDLGDRWVVGCCGCFVGGLRELSQTAVKGEGLDS